MHKLLSSRTNSPDRNTIYIGILKQFISSLFRTVTQLNCANTVTGKSLCFLCFIKSFVKISNFINFIFFTKSLIIFESDCTRIKSVKSFLNFEFFLWYHELRVLVFSVVLKVCSDIFIITIKLFMYYQTKNHIKVL